MKRHTVMALALVGCGYAFSGEATLVERAKKLFSEDMVNDPAVVYSENKECAEFVHDWKACADKNEIDAVNRVLLSALTSFRVVVSTNNVDDGVSYNVIRDRKEGLAFPRLEHNHECIVSEAYLLTLARYIGTLQKGVYVRNRHAAGYDGFCSERRRENRIRLANFPLERFRNHLIMLCGMPIIDLKRTMSRTEYGDYIREFVKEARMSEDEIVRLLHDDIWREGSGDPAVLYKTTYDNPLNWYAWNAQTNPSVEERVSAIVRRIDNAAIKGNTLSEKLTACQILDGEVCAVQSELWDETHNVTNLLMIWRCQRRFFKQDASRKAKLGAIKDCASYLSSCFSTMRWKNKILIDKVLNDMAKSYTPEELTDLKKDIDDIFRK